MTAAPVSGSVTSPGRMPGGLARVLAARPARRWPCRARMLAGPGPSSTPPSSTVRAMPARSHLWCRKSSLPHETLLQGPEPPGSGPDGSSPATPDPPRQTGPTEPNDAAGPRPRRRSPTRRARTRSTRLRPTSPPAEPPEARPGLEPEEAPSTGSRPPGPPGHRPPVRGPRERPPPSPRSRRRRPGLSHLRSGGSPAAASRPRWASTRRRPGPPRPPRRDGRSRSDVRSRRRDTPAPTPEAPPSSSAGSRCTWTRLRHRPTRSQGAGSWRPDSRPGGEVPW